MKIRDGFVSNSSSSSFLIFISGKEELEKQITSLEETTEQVLLTYIMHSLEELGLDELREMLWAHGHALCVDYPEYCPEAAPKMQVLEAEMRRSVYNWDRYNEVSEQVVEEVISSFILPLINRGLRPYHFLVFDSDIQGTCMLTDPSFLGSIPHLILSNH